MSRTLTDSSSSSSSSSHAGSARAPGYTGQDAVSRWHTCLAWGQHACFQAKTPALVVCSFLHLANYAMDAVAVKVMWQASKVFGIVGFAFLLLPLLVGVIAMAQQQHVLPGSPARRWLLALAAVLPANLACLSVLHLLPLLTYGACHGTPIQAEAKGRTRSRKCNSGSSAMGWPSTMVEQPAMGCGCGCASSAPGKASIHRLRLSAWAFQLECLLLKHRPACIAIHAACESIPMAALQCTAIPVRLSNNALLIASAAVAAASALAAILEMAYHSTQLLQLYHGDTQNAMLPVSEVQPQRAVLKQAKKWTADIVNSWVWTVHGMLTYQAGIIVPVKWQQRLQQKLMLVPLHELESLPYVPRCMVLVQALTRPHITITNSEHPQPSSSWKALSVQRANNQPAALLWLHAGCSLHVVGHLLQAWPVAACMHKLGPSQYSAGMPYGMVGNSNRDTVSHNGTTFAALMAACCGRGVAHVDKAALPQTVQQAAPQQQQQRPSDVCDRMEHVVLTLRMHTTGPAGGPMTPGLITCCHTLLPVPLTELQLHAMRLQLEVLQVLGTYLQSPACTLHTISLRDAQLSGVSIKQLCSSLAENSSVTSLDLSSNQLGALGPRTPQDICTMLKENSSLQRLNLAYAGFGSEAAAEVLLGAMSSSSLTWLDMSQNRISDMLPATMLLVWPPRCPPLTHLNLGFNWVQDMTAPWLLLCLTHFTNLTHFWMDYNSSQLGSQQGANQARLRARRPSVEGGGKMSRKPSLSWITPVPGTEPLDVQTRGLVFVAHLTCMPHLSQALQQLQVLDLSGLSLPEDFKQQAPPGLRCSWLPAQATTSTHMCEHSTPAWALPEALSQQLQQTGAQLDLDTAPWRALNKAQLVVAMYTLVSHQSRLLITNAPLQHAEQRRSSMQGRRSTHGRTSMQGSRRSSCRWTPACLATGNSGTLSLPSQQVKSAVEKLTGLTDAEHLVVGTSGAHAQMQELGTGMACDGSDTSSPGAPQPPSRQATTQVSSFFASSSSYLAAPSGILLSNDHEQVTSPPAQQLPMAIAADHHAYAAPPETLYIPSRLSADSRPTPATPTLAEASHEIQPSPTPTAAQTAANTGARREPAFRSVSAGGWKQHLPLPPKSPLSLRTQGAASSTTGVWASQPPRSAFGTWTAVAPAPSDSGSTPSTASPGPSPSPHLAARAARNALLQACPLSVPGGVAQAQLPQGRWASPPASPIRMTPVPPGTREVSAAGPPVDDAHILEVHPTDELATHQPATQQLQHADSTMASVAPSTPRLGASSMLDGLPQDEDLLQDVSSGFEDSDTGSMTSQPEDMWVSYASKPAVNSAANVLTPSTVLGAVALPKVVVRMHHATQRASRSMQLNRDQPWPTGDWSDHAVAASGPQAYAQASRSASLLQQGSGTLASGTHASAAQPTSGAIASAPNEQLVAASSRVLGGATDSISGPIYDAGVGSISLNARGSSTMAPRQGVTSVSFDWKRASLESLQTLGHEKPGDGTAHLFHLAAASGNFSAVAPATPSFSARGRPHISGDVLCTSQGDGALASIGTLVSPAERASSGTQGQTLGASAAAASKGPASAPITTECPLLSDDQPALQLAASAQQPATGTSPVGCSPAASTSGAAMARLLPSHSQSRLGCAYQRHGRSWSQALAAAGPARPHDQHSWTGTTPAPSASGPAPPPRPLSRVSRPSSMGSRRSRQYAGSNASKLPSQTRGTLIIGHWETNTVLLLQLKDLLLPLWAALTSSWAAFEALQTNSTMCDESDSLVLRPNPACQDADAELAAAAHGSHGNAQRQAPHRAAQTRCLPVSCRTSHLASVRSSGETAASTVSPLQVLPRWYQAVGSLRLSRSSPIPEQQQQLDPGSPNHAAAMLPMSSIQSGDANRMSMEGSGRLLKLHSALHTTERNVQLLLTHQPTRRTSQLDAASVAGTGAHRHLWELHLVGVPESQDSALDALMQLVYATHPAYAARYSVQLPRRSSVGTINRPTVMPPMPSP